MEKNCILGKTHTKKKNILAKYIQKKYILGKIPWPKITVRTKYNGESAEVSAKYIQKNAFWAKYIQKKKHFGQNTMAENYIWNKIPWRKHRDFGKIHTKKMHFGQNTYQKNILGKMHTKKMHGESVEILAKYIQNKCISGKIGTKKFILGKMHTTKIFFFGKIHTKKSTFSAKYNGRKLHLGQNGESVDVSAKYIPKKPLGKMQWRKRFGKIHTKKNFLDKIQNITFGTKYNGESTMVSAKYIQTNTMGKA